MHTAEDLSLLLSSLAKEAKEQGFNLIVEPSADEDLFVIANPKTNKAACVGLTDICGTNLIVSYLIRLEKWQWYDCEGFSRDQITDIKNIRDDIFKFIPADQVIKGLI